VAALALLAIFTGVSMTILSTGFGATLASRPAQASFELLAPALGVASLAFGVWYGRQRGASLRTRSDFVSPDRTARAESANLLEAHDSARAP
jgi:hypothetical protein